MLAGRRVVVNVSTPTVVVNVGAPASSYISQDAGYAYMWHLLNRDSRSMLCLLADLSTESAWCDWVQMQTVERVALRSALQRVVLDHWECEKKKRPIQAALSEAASS